MAIRPTGVSLRWLTKLASMGEKETVAALGLTRRAALASTSKAVAGQIEHAEGAALSHVAFLRGRGPKPNYSSFGQVGGRASEVRGTTPIRMPSRSSGKVFNVGSAGTTINSGGNYPIAPWKPPASPRAPMGSYPMVSVSAKTGPAQAANAAIRGTAGQGSWAGWGGAALMGGSVLGGGVLSRMTGGSFFQGAMAGATVGGMALAGHGLSGNPKVRAEAIKQFGNEAGSWSSSVIGAMEGFGNAKYRASAFAGGALLGGFAFGGRRTHANGLNGRRGNRI